MATLSAPVVDGKIQQSTSAESMSSAIKKKSGSTLDKDAFLQLLVAQMKYQDPLEPTSNTEYISQLATFSELEEMQNVASSTDQARAQELVGKQVMMRVMSETTGEINYKAGKVEAVIIENGKTYLQIQGQPYALEDLDSVYNQEYLDAYEKALNFEAKLGKLPKVNLITEEHEEAIKALRKTYDEMSAYEKTLIPTDYLDKLKEAEEQLAKIKGEDGEDTEGGGEESEGTEGSEGTDQTE